MAETEENSRKRILLVEDDIMIASGLMYALENEGYDATHCENIRSARNEIAANKFDLALLDMQLPDGNGFDISTKLQNTDTAIIFLTIVDEENKIVKAFEEGAADYITKPFRLRELLARVKRTLAMKSGQEKPEVLTLGEASIDTAAAKVYVAGELVDLTALEYRLLLIFASNRSRLLTRAQILENIWDYGENYVEDNTLTVYVKRLREKLKDAVTIETVRGIGYRAD